MTKKELRPLYRQKRNELPEKERLRMDDLLLIQFQQIAFPFDAGPLLSYWPLKQHTEVNTHLMTDYLQFRMPELQIAYPVSDFSDHSMKALLVNDDTDFRINQYGIAEPVDGIEIDPMELGMVFVPLLAFDVRGYRVGYGKGFYDRFLARCNEHVIRIGFSFFDPIEAITDIDQFDIPLTIGITPNEVYEF
ncbi:MAG: 5-formyltetrahydrofolate cyclo-ligase [Bacteroidetes bacterium]|nr:5-formyltetrahydrofolate cyclo-ligase [Bacteroidota bacterium]